jgi:cob(I)alamin adenosyltransferase
VPRQPRVTTRTGDDGRTSLFGRERVPKYDARIALLGDLDEAQSALGLARAQAKRALASELLALQRALYELMAEIATSPEREAPIRVDAAGVAALEARTERLKRRATIPARFIVPGDDAAAAAIDLGRTIVRRAERGAARLLDEGTLKNREVLRYLNRLSDTLFVLARLQEGGARTLATPDRRRRRASPDRP